MEEENVEEDIFILKPSKMCKNESGGSTISAGDSKRAEELVGSEA